MGSGKISYYNRYGCRCELCMEAMRAYNRVKAIRREEQKKYRIYYITLKGLNEVAKEA